MKIIFYKYLEKIIFLRYLKDLLDSIKLKINAKKVNPNNLINIEWIKDMNIPYNWFIEEKKMWISWVARLKNAEDFLEVVIESHIQFLDEIILVDNKSIDNTKNICLRLVKKYPTKIKFFEYNYNVKSLWNYNILENSIESLAYYYNWSFSKSSYKYVMKLDDDNLLIPEKWKKIKNYVMNKQPNKYISYWWYNLFKKWSMIWICKNDMYSWKNWDHWIYPVSEYSYYIQSNIWLCEQLSHNLIFKRFNLSFFHLKYLKKHYWLNNIISTEIWKKQKKKIENSDILDLKSYTNETNINFIYKVQNKYATDFNNHNNI